MLRSLDVVNDALNKQDADLLQGALREKFLGLRDVKPDNTAFYLNRLVQERETKKVDNYLCLFMPGYPCIWDLLSAGQNKLNFEHTFFLLDKKQKKWSSYESIAKYF